MSKQEPSDDTFFDRADAYIQLANEQCDSESIGPVSASFMYALARFQSYGISTGCDSKDEMRKESKAAVEHLVAQYREMLDENLKDYIANFDSYTRPSDQ